MKAEISDFGFPKQYSINYRWYFEVTFIAMRMWEDIVLVCFDAPAYSDD
jgi:hypothetical protein